MGTDQETHFLPDQYSSICNLYIQRILESGLMLDEDIEQLLTNNNLDPTISSENSCKTCYKLALTGLTTTGFLYLAKKYYNRLVVPCAIIIVPYIVLNIKTIYKNQQHRKNIDLLIENFKKLHKTNSGIIRYLKLRKDVNRAKDDIEFSASTEVVLDLVEFLSEKELNIFEALKEIINYLSTLIKNIDTDDVTYLSSINFKNTIEATSNNIEENIEFVQRHNDIFVLFASKVLCFLGLSLRNITATDLWNLLDKIVPNLLEKLITTCTCIGEKFNVVRFEAKKVQIQIGQLKNTSNKHITSKLQQALVDSVTNISIILEKSQRVLAKAESAEERNFKELGSSMLDLRDHTLATYESLDVLCKLYGIISNSKLQDNNTGPQQNIQHAQHGREQQIATVKFDDSIAPIEDLKFELYIGDDDNDNDSPEAGIASRCEDDQSSRYLGLMLQELKQSLKQHQRFVAARKRRGSDADDDDKIVMLRKSRVGSPPRFKLDGVNKLDPAAEMVLPTSLTALTSTPAFAHFDKGRSDLMGMLDTIKAISGQRQVNEDVFGDSGDDSIGSSTS